MLPQGRVLNIRSQMTEIGEFTTGRPWATLARRAAAAAGCLLGLAAAVAGPADAGPDLLIHTLRHGSSQLYLVHSSTGQAQRLRETSTEDIDASWSPDGRQVLFSGREGTNTDLWLIDAETRAARRLTDHPAFDRGGRFAPDGKTIAFLSTREAGVSKLFLMDADGGNVRRATSLVEGGELNHAWSPDGKSIAFVNEVGRRKALFVLDLATGQARRINADKTSATDPAWSPDGKQIAYVERQRGSARLMLASMASGSSRELQVPLLNKSELAFTPDGKQLLVEGVETGRSRSAIYAVALDDGALQNLTRSEAEDLSGALSPDGRRLAFVSFRAGPYGQVYVTDRASGSVQRITQTDKHEFRPVWRPGATAPGA